MAVGSLQTANPALGTAARLPQTTQEPAKAGAPFVRVSRKGSVNVFDKTAQAFGANITDTIKPVGGYHRNIFLEVIASGGSAANVGATPADGPYNVISMFVLRDPFNTPIINTDGYGLYLIDKYGAQAGGINNTNIANRPSASTTINTTTGAFNIPYTVPFELDSSGYCSMVGLSAAAEPQYQINLAASATVYTTATFTTAPTVELRAYSNFWAAPTSAPDLAPPDVGSTAQWSQGVAASSWSQSSNQRIQAPRVGTFLHTVILQLRDAGASNARVDQWPSSDLTLWIDGVPYEYESDSSRKDKMYDAFGVATIDTGVRVYTFSDDVQQNPSLAQTHDRLLYTTPSTLLEIGGTSGSGGTGPFKVTWITGELWPSGGIPYTHLAQ